jgi:transport and Golgi organization protein 2
MCTVSWLHQLNGYQLFCNRDEKRTRKPARAPRVHVVGGTRCISPLDGDFGGTWIGANEFGVSVCLLNRYADVPVAAPTISRGRLVLEALACNSVETVLTRMASLDVREFAPFTIIALESGRPAAALIWNGRETTAVNNADVLVPVVSSSADQRSAVRERNAEFRRVCGGCTGVDPAALESFHSSHLRGPGANSPCMHRDDDETVSFTRLAVCGKTVTVSYSPAAPCRRMAMTSASLQL